MLKLYGFPVSNYVNMVHLALMEKGIAYEYVLTYPDQTEKFLAISPRGKAPCMETPQGFINETSVILEYLEDLGTGKPLLPADPYARACVRALMHHFQTRWVHALRVSIQNGTATSLMKRSTVRSMAISAMASAGLSRRAPATLSP